MNQCIRPFRMSLVSPLLLVSLAWSLVGAQLRIENTPPNFRELFIGRCDEYQTAVFPYWIHKPKNCTDLWEKFYSVFAYKNSCDFDVSSYDEFLLAARHNISAHNKLCYEYEGPDELERCLRVVRCGLKLLYVDGRFALLVMYWSGRVTPLVYEYTADARRYITVRDYLPGYIVRNVYTWCGKVENVSEGVGMNFSFCDPWEKCDGDKLVASESFWKGLSAHFARSVQGDVRVMLNGSNGEAYRGNQSTFGAYELHNLDASRNPTLHVYLVHDIEPRANSTRETCNNGTLVQLRKDVEEKGIQFDCTEDPREVMYLQCADHLTSARCRLFVDVSSVNSVVQPQHLSVSAAVATSLLITLASIV